MMTLMSHPIPSHAKTVAYFTFGLRQLLPGTIFISTFGKGDRSIEKNLKMVKIKAVASLFVNTTFVAMKHQVTTI